MKPAALGYVVVGLTFVSLVVSGKATHDTREVNEQLNENQRCLFGFIAENSRITKVRAEATAEKDDAISAVLDGVSSLTLKPDPDRAKNQSAYRDLLASYRTASRDLMRERASNPLPNLPERCSDLPVR